MEPTTVPALNRSCNRLTDNEPRITPAWAARRLPQASSKARTLDEEVQARGPIAQFVAADPRGSSGRGEAIHEYEQELGEPGRVAAQLLSLPAREPDQDADFIPVANRCICEIG